MKKILVLILALCFVLVLSVDAFAAAKPKVTKQPETSTTKKGSVSFSFQTDRKVRSITWYFIDPSDPTKPYTGKTLQKKFKKLKITGPNSKKITLKNVPDEMHSWTVYAHVNDNAYKIDTDRVQLLIAGKEPPAEGPIQDGSKSSGSGSNSSSGSESSDEPEVKTFTISCNEKALRKIDATGKAEETDPVSRIQFTNMGSFDVSTEETFTSWTVNGARFEVAEPINGFKIQNLATDMSLNLKIVRPSAATANRDETNMCSVKCVGCTFSSPIDGIRSSTSGQVPAGSIIYVMADTADLRDAGYKINGAAPINQGLSMFRYTVTGDVEIIASK